MSFWTDLLSNSALGPTLERQNQARREQQAKQDTAALNMAQTIASQQASRTFQNLSRKDALAFETSPETVKARADAVALEDKYNIEARMQNKELLLQQAKMDAEIETVKRKEAYLSNLKMQLDPEASKARNQLAVLQKKAEIAAETDPLVQRGLNQLNEYETARKIAQQSALTTADMNLKTSPEYQAGMDIIAGKETERAVNQKLAMQRAEDKYAMSPEGIAAQTFRDNQQIESERKMIVEKAKTIVQYADLIVGADTVKNFSESMSSFLKAGTEYQVLKEELGKTRASSVLLGEKLKSAQNETITIPINGKNTPVIASVNPDTNSVMYLAADRDGKFTVNIDPNTVDANSQMALESLGKRSVEAAMDMESYRATLESIPLLQKRVAEAKASYEYFRRRVERSYDIIDANRVQEDMKQGNSSFKSLLDTFVPANPKPTVSEPAVYSTPWGGGE